MGSRHWYLWPIDAGNNNNDDIDVGVGVGVGHAAAGSGTGALISSTPPSSAFRLLPPESLDQSPIYYILL